MPILKAATEFERVHIPARIYKATLTGVRVHQFPDMDNPAVMKDHLIWSFEITGKEKSVTVEAITSMAFSAKSNARKYVKALLGAEPHEECDTDELIGLACQVKVDDKTKDGQVYSRVTDAFALDSGEGF